MTQHLPGWFSADHIFFNEGWYVGSPTGMHIGPYLEETIAQKKSREISEILSNAISDGDRVRLVRKIMHQEWTAGDIRKLTKSQELTVGANNAPVELPVRRGEPKKVWFRTGRIFSVAGAFFISTREGIEVGPYTSEHEAVRDSKRLAKFLADTDGSVSPAQLIHEFKHHPVMWIS
ncbi:MAG: DUF6316 family protein [Proteobacteria bacterium]|nr:DUF6316 family protein [Pseudomonadota bacterium]